MKNTILFLGIFLMASMLFACAPKSVPLEKPEVTGAFTREVPEVIKEDWKVEWEKVLRNAKKEGQVILYTSTQAEVRQALMEGFGKRTGITLNLVAGRGPEIAAKITAERRAGLYMADAYLGGTPDLILTLKQGGFLDPIMPELFLPEVLNTSLWYKGALPFIDKEKKFAMTTRMMAGGEKMDAAIDTSKVSKSELVSWHDLLKPKFKGEMIMLDPTSAGKAQSGLIKAMMYYGLDEEFMLALAKQEPVITRDNRTVVDWVAKGKKLVAIRPESDLTFGYIEAGAKIDIVVFKETTSILGGGSSALGILSNPPHPAARKLFLNWFLSKEGQAMWSYVYKLQSPREDTPKDHLEKWQIREAGVDYPIEDEEFTVQRPKYVPLLVKAFGSLVR